MVPIEPRRVAGALFLVLTTSLLLEVGHGQFSDKTPPRVHVQRNWNLPENLPAGRFVDRVRVEYDGDVVYGLEAISVSGGGPQAPKSFPFGIDPVTGEVKLNESLAGRAGQNINLYVTVSDGPLTTKTEIFVTIVPPNSNKLLYSDHRLLTTRIPFPGPPGIRAPNLQALKPIILATGNPSRGTLMRPALPINPVIDNNSNNNNNNDNSIGIILNNNNNNINNNQNIDNDDNSSSNSLNNGPRDQPYNFRPLSKIDEDLQNLGFKSPEVKDGNDGANNSGPDTGASEPVPSIVSPQRPVNNQHWTLMLLPIALICALVLGFGMATWSLVKGRARTTDHVHRIDNKKLAASVNVHNLSRKPNGMIKRLHSLKMFGTRLDDWDKRNSPKLNDENDDLSHQQEIDDRFEFPRHRLKVFNILGEGCFGQVWRCEATDIDGHPGPRVVAVKTLKENAGERERIDLAQELKVMKSLEPHPHVVRLLGCCTDREPIFVILEYVSGGKLQSFLRASREERSQGRPGLTSRDLTGFVYQVAKGMEYLTSRGIIHRDLAARNVLIDENRVCKVADFGFARDVAANQVYERKSEGRLPIRWMAPESLYDNIFSVKSDVWSFGVLIWEIVTLGSTPYPGLAAAEVMRRIKEGYRLDRPEHCKRELYNVMYYCWDKDPACRPSFPELVNLTEGLLLDETDYIELDRFPDHSYYNVLNLSGEKL